MRKAKDLYAYLSNANAIDMKKIERVADKVLATNGVRVRPIDMKNFDADVERVWEVYNSAWERNWGFVPMSREEFLLMGKEMKQILKPELVLIGEVGGRVVGFALALAGHQPGAQAGRAEAVPHRASQNPVLSTFDQKCTGSRTGGGGGVPRLRAGGGFLCDAGPQRPEAGLWRLRNVLDTGRQRTDESLPGGDGGEAVQDVPNLRMELRTMRLSTSDITGKKKGSGIERHFREMPQLHSSE